mmetsp:Transcript_21364/g.61267  ORF Transcript_21364/g.61267 Transcript_21364/m.61267 type:complete len:241 (+) Transcript_21364:293-1015(+)
MNSAANGRDEGSHEVEGAERRSQKILELQQRHHLHEQTDANDSKSMFIFHTNDFGKATENLAQSDANEAILIMDKKVVKGCTEQSILKRPRHSLHQVTVKALGKEPAEISQQCREEDGTKDGGGIVRRRIVLEGLEGNLRELDEAHRTKQLGKDRRDDDDGHGVADAITDIVRQIVGNCKCDDAECHVEIIREHGRWTAHPQRREGCSSITRYDAQTEGMEPVHLEVVILAIAYGHAALE